MKVQTERKIHPFYLHNLHSFAVYILARSATQMRSRMFAQTCHFDIPDVKTLPFQYLDLNKNKSHILFEIWRD